MSGLFDILKACRYCKMLLGMGIVVIFSQVWTSLWIMASTLLHGDSVWDMTNYYKVRRFFSRDAHHLDIVEVCKCIQLHEMH